MVELLTHGSSAAKAQDENLHGDDALALGSVDIGSISDENRRAAHTKSSHFDVGFLFVFGLAWFVEREQQMTMRAELDAENALGASNPKSKASVRCCPLV